MSVWDDVRAGVHAVCKTLLSSTYGEQYNSGFPTPWFLASRSHFHYRHTSSKAWLQHTGLTQSCRLSCNEE